MFFHRRFCLFLILMTVGAALAACIGVSQGMEPAMPAATSRTDSVALIVLDNFSEQVAPSNCVYVTEGEGNYVKPGTRLSNTTSEFESYLISGIAHGELVYQHMEDLITTTIITGEVHATGPITVASISTAKHAHKWSINGQKLYVIGVDVQPATTASLRISQTITALEQLDSSVSRFVLNASFAMVPCRLKNHLNQDLTDRLLTVDQLPDDMQALHKALQQVHEQPDPIITTEQITSLIASGLAMRFANLALTPSSQSANCRYKELWDNERKRYQPDLQVFTTTLATDPLVHALRGSGKIVTVAAASNAAFNFPFAPAHFPNIISASAGEGQTNDSCSGFTSNSAQWRVEDDTFIYPNTTAGVTVTRLCLDIGGALKEDCSIGPTPDPVKLNGSSFAAPRLAFYIARHLLLFGNKSGCVEKLKAKSQAKWPNDPLSDLSLPSECQNLVPSTP